MHEIDVDMVGLEPLQALLDRGEDASAAAVAARGEFCFRARVLLRQAAADRARQAALPDVDDAHPPTRPRIVKRVLDEMHDDPSRPWTAADMAEVAGVSVRRLQEGFREYVGASPRECLTDIRLARVREGLLRGADGFTVADVAMRWGLMHTGRFAAAYRRKYGESPSETLRACPRI